MLQKFARKLGFMLLVALCFTTLSFGQSDTIEVPIQTIAWSPLGDQIAFGGGNNGCDPEIDETKAAFIVDAVNQSLLHQLTSATCDLTSMDWASDGQRIAVSGFDGYIRIWDSISGELLVTSKRHQFGRWQVKWSPDDGQLANILNQDEDFTFSTFNSTSGDLIMSFGRDPGFEVHRPTSVDWDPDGTLILNGVRAGLDETNGFIRIWDSATGVLVTEIPQESWVFSVAWKPDGTQFATASANSETRIWDVATGEVVRVISPNQGRLRWHPFEDLLLGVSGGENSQVLVWDTTTGEVVQSFDTQSPLPRTDWSPYGGRVVYNQRDRIAINPNTRSLGDDTLQIAVVAPTLERVIGIAEQCYADAADQTRAGAVAPTVTEALTRETLPDFVAEIEALPADTIPAACAADLIAVAEAVIAAEE